jgi:hypothetical protein
MPRLLRLSAFVLAACLGAGPARADMIAPPPPLQRAAMAQTVVIGKVVSIEDKTVTAKRYPGDTEKGEYQVAVVKIEDAVIGAKGLTHVRVGFIPASVNPNVKIRRPLPVQLKKGDEVILFLQPHFDANFHVAPNYYDGIFKAPNSGFEQLVPEIKRAGKLLNDPTAGLTSKEVKDRTETATLLIARYRGAGFYNPNRKQEPIDAKESKLILEALAEADWGKGEERVDRLTPAAAFTMLRLTDKDGWFEPRDLEKFPVAAKRWLADNADKYRIQKFVADEKKDKKD